MGGSGDLGDLARVIPVFPLSGVLLLPRGHLPLNIFEPRYLDMVRDAMASERLIGMVQPRGSLRGKRPALYDVGCVGRISAFEETEDGRYLITLTGISRFRILSELTTVTAYRQVEVDYAPFSHDRTDSATLAEPLRAELLARLEVYLDDHGLRADWNAVRNAVDEMLVNAIAMLCPFDAVEKQALLEAPTIAERAQALITLMRFEGHGAPDTTVRH